MVATNLLDPYIPLMDPVRFLQQHKTHVHGAILHKHNGCDEITRPLYTHGSWISIMGTFSIDSFLTNLEQFISVLFYSV